MDRVRVIKIFPQSSSSYAPISQAGMQSPLTSPIISAALGSANRVVLSLADNDLIGD